MLNLFKPQPQKPKTLGQIGEEYAREEYKKRGYKVVAANFFNKKGLRKGEIDVVAVDSKKIIFVEVKARMDGAEKFGSGAESVNVFKQLKLLKAVKIYLAQNPKYRELQPQIDVCALKFALKFAGVDKTPYSVTIIPNAVEDWN